MDAKTRPAIQYWTLIQCERKLTRGRRKRNLIILVLLVIARGRGSPKSGLHTTVAMGNNTFRYYTDASEVLMALVFVSLCIHT